MFLYKGHMIKDYKEGLENLKNYVENLPPEPEELLVNFETEEGTFEIVEKFIETQPTLIIREMVKLEEISQKIPESYEKLGAFCKEKGIEPIGPPFTLWPNWSMESETNEMLAGFPVAEAVEGLEEIEYFTIPEGNVVMITHKGAYAETMPAYNAIVKYIQDNGKEINGASWEVYVTDPTVEPDTNNWITEIYFPVK